MKNNKYIINSKRMASTIRFLIGVSYNEIPHNTLKDKCVFEFEDTPLLRDTIEGIMTLRKQLNNK